MENPGALRPAGSPILIFDGDCGFCTTSARWIERHLTPQDGRHVEVSPWQRTDLDALGVEAQRCTWEVVWVGPDGDQRGGAAAVAALLRHRGGPLGLLGAVMGLPVIRAAAAVVYRVVAANRQRLPGGTPACALPPRTP